MHRFFLAIILITFQVGCSHPLTPTATPNWMVEDTQANDPWADVDPSGQVIRLWHAYTYERATALAEILDEFNRTNPWQIRIEAEYQEGNAALLSHMLDVLNTPNSPHLVATSVEDAAIYWLYNGIVDMTSLIDSPRWGFSQVEKDDFLPKAWIQYMSAASTQARLGMLLSVTPDVLYYNQDWLQELGYTEPPSTPREFKQMACQAAQAPFHDVQDTRSTGYLANPQSTTFTSLVFAFGGEIFDTSAIQYTLDHPASHQAMEFFQELFQAGCARLTVERYRDEEEFTRGRALFTIGSLASLPYYAEAVEKDGNFPWGIAPLPHVTTTPRLNVNGSGLSILKTNPAQELAAWLFIQYFSSPEVQVRWASTTHSFPVRLSALNATDFSVNQQPFFQIPGYQNQVTLLPEGFTEPALPGHYLVQTRLREALVEIANGADINNTLSQLNQAANTILQEQLTRQLPTVTP
jgi:multiple sugar transport system substrate-binding protein